MIIVIRKEAQRDERKQANIKKAILKNNSSKLTFDSSVQMPNFISPKAQQICITNIEDNEYKMISETSLEQFKNNKDSQTCLEDIQCLYDESKQKYLDDEKVNLVLYLHSTHGKLLIGSFPYDINQLNTSQTLNQKIKNCPDKNAEITFKIEIQKVSQSQIEFPPSQNQLKLLDQHPILLDQGNNKFNQISKRSSILESIEKKIYEDLDRKSIQKINQKSHRRRINSEVSSPLNYNPSPFNKQFGEDYFKYKTYQSDKQAKSKDYFREQFDKQQDNHTYKQQNLLYLDRLGAIQKQLRSKKDEIIKYQMKERFKENQFKNLEREFQSLKGRSIAIENNAKIINKKLNTAQQRNKQLEIEIRKHEEKFQDLTINSSNIVQKLERKELNYKDQIKSLNEKYQKSESEKQKLLFEKNDKEQLHEQMMKKLTQASKEKQKKLLEEQATINKKLMRFQRQLIELKSQNSTLKEKQIALVKQFQIKESQIQKLNNQNEELREQINNITSDNKILQFQRQKNQGELKLERQVKLEIKKLQNQLLAKDQEVDSLLNKLKLFQFQVDELQLKITNQTEKNQQFQEEYQKLYYENVSLNQENSKKSHLNEEFMQQHEKLQKILDRLNEEIKTQQERFDTERQELKDKVSLLQNEKIKQFDEKKNLEAEISFQKQNNRRNEQSIKDQKSKIKDLTETNEKLEFELAKIYASLHENKGQSLLLGNKNKYLQSNLEEIKKIKLEKEIKYQHLMQEFQSFKQVKQEENQEFNQIIKQFKQSIHQYTQQIEERALILIQKQLEIQQLDSKCEVYKKKIEEEKLLRFQSNLTAEQYRNAEQKLHEKNVIFEEKVNSLIVEIKQMTKQLNQKNQEAQQHKDQILKLQGDLSAVKKQLANYKAASQQKQNLFMILQNEKKQLESYFSSNLESIQKQLKDKNKEFNALELLKKQKQNYMQIKQKQFQVLSQKINEIEEEYERNLQQKQKLKNQLKKYQNNQKILISTNETLKKLNNDLNIQLTIKSQNLQQNNNQLIAEKELLQSELIKKRSQNQKLKQKEIQNEQQLHILNQKYQALNQKHKELNKNHIQLNQNNKKYEKYAQEKLKNCEQKNIDLSKKIEILNKQMLEKQKNLVQLENDKRNRIQILKSTIEQLKKQNFELQNFAFNEKTNNLKQISVLTELSGALNKLQKSSGVKAITMIPIREMMRKLEQSLLNTSKFVAEYQKIFKKEEIKNLQSEKAFKKKPSQQF